MSIHFVVELSITRRANRDVVPLREGWGKEEEKEEGVGEGGRGAGVGERGGGGRADLDQCTRHAVD